MYKRKWYLQTWLISLIFAFSIFIIPAILGIILLWLKAKENKVIRTEHMSLLTQIEELKNINVELTNVNKT